MGVPAGAEATVTADGGIDAQPAGTDSGPINAALPTPAVAAAPPTCAASTDSVAADASAAPAVSLSADAVCPPLSPMKSVTLPNQLPGMKNADEKIVSHKVALGPQLLHKVCNHGGTGGPQPSRRIGGPASGRRGSPTAGKQVPAGRRVST